MKRDVFKVNILFILSFQLLWGGRRRPYWFGWQ